MNVTSCEKKDNKTAELSVTVTAEEFDVALEESYKKNRGQIAIPGFRKGKAPRKLIEKMYGASVFYNDALDMILPAVCSHGISEENLRTVGYPQILDVNVAEDNSVTVKYSVDLYPEATVKDYKGLRAVREPVSIEDSAVDSELAAMQLKSARIQTADRPAANGDTVIIDFEGFIDGVPFEGGKAEDYELALGSNTFIPGFEEKLNGVQAGEERDLDLVFPENYQEDLAGKAVVFKVKVKEVKEKILPDLDDEFAKDVSEFDTLEEYKASIRENLLKERQTSADKAFEEAVFQKLAEVVEADIPESMINSYIDNQLSNMSQQLSVYGMDIATYFNMLGTNEAGFRDSMRPSAENQIKISLGLEKVAELENLEPTEEEIEGFFKETAEKYGTDVETVKSGIDRDSAVYELKMQAASKFVVEHAVAEEPKEDEAKDDKAEEAAEEAPAPKKTRKSTKAKAETAETGEAEAEAPTKKTTRRKKAAEETPKDE
ncbi:MAG TPA: trigger factor [Papillibacter sp.]|nr:trigger factor [Papillibacter sp.]